MSRMRVKPKENTNVGRHRHFSLPPHSAIVSHYYILIILKGILFLYGIILYGNKVL